MLSLDTSVWAQDDSNNDNDNDDDDVDGDAPPLPPRCIPFLASDSMFSIFYAASALVG